MLEKLLLYNSPKKLNFPVCYLIYDLQLKIVFIYNNILYFTFMEIVIIHNRRLMNIADAILRALKITESGM